VGEYFKEHIIREGVDCHLARYTGSAGGCCGHYAKHIRWPFSSQDSSGRDIDWPPIMEQLLRSLIQVIAGWTRGSEK